MDGSRHGRQSPWSRRQSPRTEVAMDGSRYGLQSSWTVVAAVVMDGSRFGRQWLWTAVAMDGSRH